MKTEPPLMAYNYWLNDTTSRLAVG